MAQPIGGMPDDTRPAGPRRVIVRRRALPDGRAVVGALLVTVAAVGAFTVAGHDPPDPRRDYVVAVRDIEAGATLTADDLAVEPMVLSPALERSALRTVDTAIGTTALAPLTAGQVLIGPSLRTPGADDSDGPVPGAHELTLPVDLDRAPDPLARGDRVTVLATDPGRGTHVAVADARVLRLTTSERIGSSQGQLTVALDSAEAVIRGADLSFLDLTVVLTTRADAGDYPEWYPHPQLPVEPTVEPAP